MKVRIDYSYKENNGAVFNATQHDFVIMTDCKSVSSAKKAHKKMFNDSKERSYTVISAQQV